jgi:5'-3' exonuclease
MKYLLVDTANLFSRARHSSHRGADTWTKLGLCLHITFNSLMKADKLHKPDHVIFCLEARSWRKDHNLAYKANRKETRAKMNVREAEEDKEFWACFDDLTKWLDQYTNASVIRVERAEADDLIARWIHNHPDDQHTILSNDSDFMQLLADNVRIYNGMTNQLITLEGYFDDRGQPVIDTKTKEQKPAPDPEWLLFEKCMRGDASDNVMSAYPGVRTKGTSKKVGLIEAYADRDKKGWAWNNMMLQKWVDHNGTEHRVLDRYQANRELIDLTAQPADILASIDAVMQGMTAKGRTQIGSQLMKFCGKYDLVKMQENVKPLAEILSKNYPQEQQTGNT